MSVWGHFKSLLWKNWLLWRRHMCLSICELICPALLLCFLLLLVLALPGEEKHDLGSIQTSSSVGQYVSPNPVPGNPNYLEFAGNNLTYKHPFQWCESALQKGPWRIALAPYTSPTNFTTLLLTSLANDIRTFLSTEYLTPDPIWTFGSNQEVDDNVTSGSYDDSNNPKICFAVVVDDTGSQTAIGGVPVPQAVTLTIRFNATSINPNDQSPYGTWYPIFQLNELPQINTFDRSKNTEPQEDFIDSGFVQIMNSVQNYLLNLVSPNGSIAVAFVPMRVAEYLDDPMIQDNGATIGFFLFISTILPVLRMISKVTSEKETKVREVMRIMGLTDTPYWLSWIVMYILIYSIISLLCMLVSIPMFKYSDKGIVFLMFLLYGLSCISYSMLISSFFSRAKTAILVGVAVFLVTYFTMFSVTTSTSQGTRQLLSIFPAPAMAQGFYVLLGFEGIQTGIHWDNVNSEYQNYTTGDALLFLFFDTIVYLLLSLYFDKVMPTETGRRLPFYFPFTKQFWLGHTRGDKVLSESTQKLLDEEYADSQERLQRTNNLEVPDQALLRQQETGQAMLIRKLRKHFGNKIAVDGIDLDIYEGQIFALLGHNGAGKTTTISMLTGMMEPTDGDMTVHDYNFRRDMVEIRKQLGICPQHNVLFNDLSVYEHLYLFSTFKGMRDKAEINAAIQDKLIAVNLKDKENTPAKFLSGGQKRKLSLCMALIGGSQIVMLDEPTSGMDLTARRNVWDMLKNEKNKRIIILTTHYMEEADILADRIAIMADGKVRCVGSPLFLKNRYGVGYNLTISKKLNVASQRHTNSVTALIKSHIPDAKLINDVSAEVIYQLPITASTKFKAFFEELDSRLVELDLEHYGVSVTTLEEVFLRVARGDEEERLSSAQRPVIVADLQEKKPMLLTNLKDERLKNAGSATDTFDIEPDANFNIAENRVRGMMFFPHVWALFKKRFLYGYRDYKGLCCEIFCPIVMVVIGLALLTQVSVFSDEEQYIDGLSHLSTPQNVMYGLQEGSLNGGTVNDIMGYINSTTGGLATPNNSLTYNSSIDDAFDFNQYLYETRDTDPEPYRVGAYYFSKADSTNQYEVLMFQNCTYLQSIPTFYNLLGQGIISNAYGVPITLTTVNHPLPLTSRQSNLARNAGTFYIAMIFAFGMAFIPTGIITFIVKEKEGNVKHQHLVSGVSIPAYWIANFLWDIIKHLIPALLSILFILAFQLRSLTDTQETFFSVICLFVLFGFAIAPFTYLLSFAFDNYSTAQFIIFLLNLITGAILATASWLMRLIASSSRDVNQYLQYFFRLSPIYCFSYGIMNASNRSTYQMLFGLTNEPGALNWDIAGADIVFLLAESVVYSLLILLVEWGKTVQWLRNISDARDPGENRYTPDEDVETEALEAENAVAEDVAVKVVNVRKVYGSQFSRGEVKVAVEKVSFRVLQKECFALLGVNGAGKTSTFRILTGEYAPTQGNAFISGTSVLTNMAEARFKIGYCPQFDAISDLLTCQEHLELYGRIKGIPRHLIKPFAQQKLTEMGLDQYAKIRAGTLSGGNKRKLSVAMACIGNPPVVFLDEPSAGMDPDARKRMWKVINEIKSKKTSIILTTHSMDEAEALCDRIAIMVGGRIRCLGTAMRIKNKFGSGYELTVKVRAPSKEEVTSGCERIRSTLSIQDIIAPDKLQLACEALGAGNKFLDICDGGTGAALHQELVTDGGVNIENLVEWFVIEFFGQRIFEWLSREFEGAKTVEHFLTFFKFKIEKTSGQSLGYVFGRIEEMKSSLNISEYSLSQTTLEQIFNMFAMQSYGEAGLMQMADLGTVAPS